MDGGSSASLAERRAARHQLSVHLAQMHASILGDRLAGVRKTAGPATADCKQEIALPAGDGYAAHGVCFARRFAERMYGNVAGGVFANPPSLNSAFRLGWQDATTTVYYLRSSSSLPHLSRTCLSSSLDLLQWLPQVVGESYRTAGTALELDS